MIYRIGDNEITSYDNHSLRTTKKSGSEEKFSLEHRDSQPAAEKQDKKDDEKQKLKISSSASGFQNRSREGVRLELTGQSTSAEELTKETATERPNLLADVQRWLRDFLSSVKSFLYKIWNDEGDSKASEISGTDVPEDDAESREVSAIQAKSTTVKTEEQIASEIQDCIHTGNLKQMMSILTDDGKKCVAKNSTLVTYYDKTGRLTQPSASDKERILHGDRHVKKL